MVAKAKYLGRASTVSLPFFPFKTNAVEVFLQPTSSLGALSKLYIYAPYGEAHRAHLLLSPSWWIAFCLRCSFGWFDAFSLSILRSYFIYAQEERSFQQRVIAMLARETAKTTVANFSLTIHALSLLTQLLFLSSSSCLPSGMKDIDIEYY